MFQMESSWQFISVDEFSAVAPVNKATRRAIESFFNKNYLKASS